MLSAWHAAGAVGGLLVVVAGFWVMRGARTGASERPAGGWTPATRYTLGSVLLVAGYHAVAYCTPAHWLPLRVPADRLWILAAVGVLAVIGSLACEALEKRDLDNDPA